MKARKRTIRGERSWVTENGQVELAVTVRGGHMAPVTFFRDSGAPVQPYYISPWQGTRVRTGVPVLDVLRGDFFCMPFGGGNAWRGENHPVHGESAGSAWSLVDARAEGGVTELRLGLTTKARPGRITKRLSLVDGQNAVYCRHDLEGFEGRMCLSHHATLAVPETPGSLRVTVSPTRLATVVPRKALANTANEYYFLEPGGRFTDLGRVPTIWKDMPQADCSTHPLPYGFMDLIAVFPRIQKTPAWTAVAAPSAGFLWFALRDAEVLPQTVFWMSNGGRHAPPWSGVNRCLGVEDGCAYYTFGLSDSAKKNELNRAGIPTTLAFARGQVTRITHIQGMVRIPSTFDRVKSVDFGRNSVSFSSWSGKKVETPLRWSFLSTGELGSTESAAVAEGRAAKGPAAVPTKKGSRR
jgi:hypothetical protein